MRKLNRSLAQEPSCLNNFHYQTDKWEKVTSQQKKRIWQEIYEFQGRFCVYCESAAFQPSAEQADTGHIEHFYNKGAIAHNGTMPNKHLTFEWDNLFGCCGSNEHCGHYKDKPEDGKPRSYDQTKLIKPDKEDPEEYFYFSHTSVDAAKIKIKDGLTEEQNARAEETLRVLNLNEPCLNNLRKAQVTLYVERLAALESFALIISSEDYKKEFLAIKKESETVEYRTAIKQICFNQ